MTSTTQLSAAGTRQVISLRDLTDDDIAWIVGRGTEFAADLTAHKDPLRGRVLGVYFSRTSTRTRTSFTTGALRLGAQVITYGPDDLQLNTGETPEDTARVLGSMLDGLVIRTAGPPEEMRLFADAGTPVVNAMSSDEHPTQALADLTTLTVALGTVRDLRLLYVGEGNNTATALALALARCPGTRVEFRTPEGYGLPSRTADEARRLARRYGAELVERHDMDDLPAEADAVYTTRWQTTGTSKADPRWRSAFEPFRVDGDLMRRYPDARFLHDLPAHRGEEVTAEVLDGPASIAFEQARLKLCSAMAVLEWVMAGG